MPPAIDAEGREPVSSGGKVVLASNLFIAAGTAMIVGTFLPWVKLVAPFVGALTFSGLDVASELGVSVVVVGACLGLIGFLLRHRRRRHAGLQAGAALLSAATGAISVYVWIRISQGIAQLYSLAPSIGGLNLGDLVTASQGLGLYVLSTAAAIGLGTSLYLVLQRTD